MHDDYLWDRSGGPDPEIVELERALAAFRHRGTTPAFPHPESHRRPAAAAPWRYPLTTGLIAASLIAAIGARLFGIRPHSAAWDVAVLDGRPTIARQPVHARGTWSVGQWLVTDASSRAEIAVAGIGSVEVAPNSRVRLLSARAEDNRIELERGEVRATIFAPPRQFAVEASSGTAIDLGCRYTLQIGEDGAGLLHVESGWVAYAYAGRESFVPADASAQTRPGFGPGTPYFDDADAQLREALPRVDFGAPTAGDRASALQTVLDTARRKDAITLWHLLPRLRPEERARVFDRLAQLVPPDAGITRDGVIRGDRAMLEAWWDQLDLQPLSWWRVWERPWPK
jgi:hypothetical protein